MCYISHTIFVEFIPATQALALITLIFYIIEFVIMITVIVLILRNVSFGIYWNPKNISLVSSLITFSAGEYISILSYISVMFIIRHSWYSLEWIVKDFHWNNILINFIIFWSHSNRVREKDKEYVVNHKKTSQYLHEVPTRPYTRVKSISYLTK